MGGISLSLSLEEVVSGAGEAYPADNHDHRVYEPQGLSDLFSAWSFKETRCCTETLSIGGGENEGVFEF